MVRRKWRHLNPAFRFMNPPRKLHIKSFGCQMNVYDAQRMVDTLAPEGFVETSSVDDADLVILNTCHIREKASEKVYSELGRLRVAKDEAARHGRHISIAVAGCVAQAEGNEIIRRAPVVDVGGRPAKLSSSAATAGPREEPRPCAGDRIPVDDKFGFLAPRSRKQSARAAFHPSSPCRKAATSSARSAWCPIRAARKCRARSQGSSTTCFGSPTTACAKSL